MSIPGAKPQRSDEPPIEAGYPQGARAAPPSNRNAAGPERYAATWTTPDYAPSSPLVGERLARGPPGAKFFIHAS